MPSGQSLTPRAMNKYGRMAIRHWEKTDPDRFRQIPASDREEFFTELGERAESEIQQLQDQLAGPDPGGELSGEGRAAEHGPPAGRGAGAARTDSDPATLFERAGRGERVGAR